MEFNEMRSRALAIRKSYEEYELKTTGKQWSRGNLAQGFVGDVGDLMKLVMAKDGLRTIDDVDQKLGHELADCLWSIIVLAEKYNIDLQQSFIDTMDELEQRLKKS